MHEKNDFLYTQFGHFFLSCGEVYEFGGLRQNGPETAQSSDSSRELSRARPFRSCALVWRFVTRAHECDWQASLANKAANNHQTKSWHFRTWQNYKLNKRERS